MSEKQALCLKGLSKTIDDFCVQLDFDVHKGELISIVGPSGCGKTTTMSLICGLISPDSGTIEIDGQDVTDYAPDKRSTAVVFQDYALFPNMNAGKNIAFPLKLRHMPRAEINARVEELLCAVKLDSFSKRRTNELSGGEKQRIAFARALAAQPEILLLDEPLSALDSKLRKDLRREICQIHREFAQTTIYVTHDQSEALSMSDRILVMNEGRIQQYDTPENVYNHPANLFTATFMGEGNTLPYSIIPRSLVTSSVDSSRFVYQEMGSSHCIFFRPEQVMITLESDVKKAYDLELCNTLRFADCELVCADYEGDRWALEYRFEKNLIVAYSPVRPNGVKADLSVRLDRILQFNEGKFVN